MFMSFSCKGFSQSHMIRCRHVICYDVINSALGRGTLQVPFAIFGSCMFSIHAQVSTHNHAFVIVNCFPCILWPCTGRCIANTTSHHAEQEWLTRLQKNWSCWRHDVAVIAWLQQITRDLAGRENGNRFLPWTFKNKSLPTGKNRFKIIV